MIVAELVDFKHVSNLQYVELFAKYVNIRFCTYILVLNFNVKLRKVNYKYGFKIRILRTDRFLGKKKTIYFSVNKFLYAKQFFYESLHLSLNPLNTCCGISKIAYSWEEQFVNAGIYIVQLGLTGKIKKIKSRLF